VEALEPRLPDLHDNLPHPVGFLVHLDPKKRVAISESAMPPQGDGWKHHRVCEHVPDPSFGSALRPFENG
jgi:hypothetical protein